MLIHLRLLRNSDSAAVASSRCFALGDIDNTECQNPCLTGVVAQRLALSSHARRRAGRGVAADFKVVSLTRNEDVLQRGGCLQPELLARPSITLPKVGQPLQAVDPTRAPG